jgi:hypothetical protein|tara:strand:+ start:1086 stop:1256 length:171 start_codon:yes stop_codon:yes gene_type:complete
MITSGRVTFYRLTYTVKSYDTSTHSRQRGIYMYHVFRGAAMIVIAIIVFGIGLGAV